MGTPVLPSEMLICNQALSRMGSTQQISSFTDNSNEAMECALWYPSMRDAMLSDFPWPWAEAYYSLNQVAGPETTLARANAQWLRSYRYPTDCLKMRRIVFIPPSITATLPQTTGTTGFNYMYNEPWRRAVGSATPISYGLGNDSTGKLIMTDFVSIYGLAAIYTQAVSDPAQFEPDFADALTWRVAMEISMGLGYDSKKRDFAAKEYAHAVKQARATAMNSIQSDIPYVEHQAEVIRRRWRS